jgi:hypothetical protein
LSCQSYVLLGTVPTGYMGIGFYKSTAWYVIVVLGWDIGTDSATERLLVKHRVDGRIGPLSRSRHDHPLGPSKDNLTAEV